jgi:hypothetical protein
MEQALVVPFLYREFCAKTLEQGDVRCWERSPKTISSSTAKMSSQEWSRRFYKTVATPAMFDSLRTQPI